MAESPFAENSILGGFMDTKIILIYCVCSDFLEKEKTLEDLCEKNGGLFRDVCERK